MQEKSTLSSDILLLTAAAIWGFAFVAQRVGMEYIGPFTYNGLRFALGSLSLIPLIWWPAGAAQREQPDDPAVKRFAVNGGLIAGLVLFIGSSLQQTGMVYTTAGKGGFITGLYVVFVPIMGLVIGKSTHLGTWVGAIVAVFGLYLLSVTEALTISNGDLLVLASAFFWAIHVLVIGWVSPKVHAIKLAATQFGLASVLSIVVALIVENIELQPILAATLPILYGGLFSTGIAFTLQIIGQKKAHPAHAAIILSLEGAFAALGGWLLLDEVLSMRALSGCTLMLTGMILSQLNATELLLKIINKRLKKTS